MKHRTSAWAVILDQKLSCYGSHHISAWSNFLVVKVDAKEKLCTVWSFAFKLIDLLKVGLWTRQLQDCSMPNNIILFRRKPLIFNMSWIFVCGIALVRQVDHDSWLPQQQRYLDCDWDLCCWTKHNDGSGYMFSNLDSLLHCKQVCSSYHLQLVALGSNDEKTIQGSCMGKKQRSSAPIFKHAVLMAILLQRIRPRATSEYIFQSVDSLGP